MQEYLAFIYLASLKKLATEALTSEQLVQLPGLPSWDVLALGKAAVPMATAAMEALGPKLNRGYLLTKEHHLSPQARQHLQGNFLLREAGHPIPNLASLEATEELLHWLADDNHALGLLVLLSGGSSTLLVAPNSPLDLGDLQKLNQVLLASGLPIEKLNVLRKHLSRVKGGQLGAWASRFYSDIQQFLLVDVCAPQLELKTILSLVGSGPFLGDESQICDAQIILEGLRQQVGEELYTRACQALGETPNNTVCRSTVLADHTSLERVASTLLEQNYQQHHDWPAVLLGEVRDLAQTIATFAKERAHSARKAVYVATGEPTVKLPELLLGRGGRCQELALRFAQNIAGTSGITFLAASSDGTDGPTEYSGALVDGQTWPKLCSTLGQSELLKMLDEHNSSGILESLPETLLQTGPTGQNINDLFLLGLELIC